MERTGDSYQANFPDKTIEYNSISTDRDSITLFTKDDHENTLKALVFNYATKFYIVSDSSVNSHKVNSKSLVQSLINEKLYHGTIDTFKRGAVSDWRALNFSTPLELSIKGVEQKLNAIYLWDAKSSGLSTTYVGCSIQPRNI